MTLQHFLGKINWQQSTKRSFQGIGIALLLFSVLLIIIGEVESWIFIPMITVSIGGAFGGIFFHLVRENILQHAKYKFFINAFCLLVFLIVFWLSLVFGLAQVGLWH